MKHALCLSLEWQVLSTLLTFAVLIAFGHPLGQALVFTIVLRIVLFVFHTWWLYLRA